MLPRRKERAVAEKRSSAEMRAEAETVCSRHNWDTLGDFLMDASAALSPPPKPMVVSAQL